MTKSKNGFWEYFITTFKEAKYLLLKYLGAAILMSIISILTNLLQVRELTYLNAMLAINCFSGIISFGIAEAIGILVNQSINSQYRVKKYVRIGSELNLIFIFLFTVFLVSCPRFVMENVTGFFPQDYTFYYLMCVDFFLCGIKEYLLEILKQMQIYRLQFFSDSLTYILVVLGFVILYFCGFYYLNLIAVVYILAVGITIAVALLALYKNKTISINMLRVQALRLTKGQWKMILNTFAIEFIWQVGAFVTSILLLRMSDAMFNTYSYLEIVLDVFNGFFYAFASVTSIKISRSLGRGQFDKALFHAKNSLKSTLIIWVLYALASMAFLYPLALGVNKDYFNLMFSVLPCYVLLMFFRFFYWNLATYMLRLGGKTVSGLILCIFNTLMFFVFCFIVRFLPNNVFLDYFIIAIPDIIGFVVEYVIYKRKKWVANINEDPNLLKNKVKCFIFDFDDTLYYGVEIDNWSDLALNFFNEHFAYKSEQERKQILKKYKCGRRGVDCYRHIKQILLDCEGSIESWTNFRQGLEVQPEAKAGKGVLMKELKKCLNLGSIYIVSNSNMTEIEERAQMYGIDLSIFKHIYYSNAGEKPKGKFYEKIMKDEGLHPEQILVVGDRFETDLRPAKELDMNICKVQDGFTFEELMG